MTTDAGNDSRSEDFASAWAHHDTAKNRRKRIQTAWNAMCGPDLFGTWIGADDDGSGSIAVTVDWPPEAQELQEVTRGF
ncbi:hypothetical protein M2C68_21175, partial [Pseudomonas sp. BAgro211]|nr:hypothetical protein [Pseudomonas sp. BAgro211]